MLWPLKDPKIVIEGLSTVPYYLKHLREIYLQLEQNYERLLNKYKRNAMDLDTDGEWSEKADIKEQEHPG